MKWDYALTAIILGISAVPVIAGGVDHAGCSDDVTMSIGKMGVMNEARLQEYIESEQHRLDRNSRNYIGDRERRSLLRRHLAKMQGALEDMHDMKLMGGCAAAAHGASQKTRISVLENRVDMHQGLLQRMIAGQNEGEQE